MFDERNCHCFSNFVP
ncbi:MAG: hypothetical protein EBR91_02110 [Flavobacteriia bacterium]|nr:hypothetical protein [Flavobacteriia bacterium]NBV67551.1 hypothetical protein [Flavobacteriia bacterium]NBV90947.1 hypothetical protein [Flavobacteriia bacterium]NBY39552.1 hypothetical protein [Flavobacteriia bacterium]